MIIDSHIHIGKWSEIFLGYESSVEQAIDVMKKAGVSAALCMPADQTPNEELFLLTHSNPDFRFYYTAWINPDDKTLDIFLENNIKNISAFKIHPSIQRRRVTDYSYLKYIKMASDHGKPVIVHCGRWQEIASYKFPLELAKKYPELKIILAHLGGDQPSLFLECGVALKDKTYNNVYLGSESVREFYFVNELVKKTGPEKIIFGSDYNLGLPQSYIPIIESLDISDSDKRMIFSENILRLIEQ